MNAAAPKPTLGSYRFARLLLALAALPLALGGWGTFKGMQTWKWPTTEAKILGSDMRIVRSERRQDGQTITDIRATVDIRYAYSVGGRDYVGEGIEPYSFGMQNSASARRQAERYRPDTIARVAYDPDDAAVAYLEPGPSSVSLMFLGVGAVIGLSGLWVRNLARRGIGQMEGDDDVEPRRSQR